MRDGAFPRTSCQRLAPVALLARCPRRAGDYGARLACRCGRVNAGTPFASWRIGPRRRSGSVPSTISNSDRPMDFTGRGDLTASPVTEAELARRHRGDASSVLENRVRDRCGWTDSRTFQNSIRICVLTEQHRSFRRAEVSSDDAGAPDLRARSYHLSIATWRMDSTTNISP